MKVKKLKKKHRKNAKSIGGAGANVTGGAIYNNHNINKTNLNNQNNSEKKIIKKYRVKNSPSQQ